MMTQQLQVSILSAPLAAIDRRALPQAWYSALGYARDGTRSQSAGPPKRLASPSAAATPVAFEQRSGTIAAASNARRAATAASAHRPLRAPGSPVAAQARLSRAILHAFTKTPRPPKRATLRLEGGGGRVQLLLREDRSGLHIVAICPPMRRTLVLRALESARIALAARGIAIATQAREVSAWN